MFSEYQNTFTGTDQSYPLYCSLLQGNGNSSSSHAPGGSVAIDAEVASQMSIRIPPYWEPGLERRGYPFAEWLTDVSTWAADTELADHKKGTAVAQRIGGTAGEIVKEIDPIVLCDGLVDEQGTIVHTGLQILLTSLEKKYRQNNKKGTWRKRRSPDLNWPAQTRERNGRSRT